MKNVLLKKLLPIVIGVVVLVSCCVIPVAADYVQGYDSVTDGFVSYPSLNNITWTIGEVYDYGDFAYDQYDGASSDYVEYENIRAQRFSISMKRGIAPGSLVYVQLLLDFKTSSEYGYQLDFNIGVLNYSWYSYQSASVQKYDDSCKAYFHDESLDDFVPEFSRENVYQYWGDNRHLYGYHFTSPTYDGDGKVLVSLVFQRINTSTAQDIHIYLWGPDVEYVVPPELPRYENPSNGEFGQAAGNLTTKEDQLNASISSGTDNAINAFKAFELSDFHDGLLCMQQLMNMVFSRSKWYLPLVQISLALGLFSFIVGVSAIAVNVHSSRSRRDNYSKSYDAGYRKGRGDYLNNRRRN